MLALRKGKQAAITPNNSSMEHHRDKVTVVESRLPPNTLSDSVMLYTETTPAAIPVAIRQHIKIFSAVGRLRVRIRRTGIRARMMSTVASIAAPVSEMIHRRSIEEPTISQFAKYKDVLSVPASKVVNRLPVSPN